MDQGENRLVHTSGDIVFGNLPHVNLSMSGQIPVVDLGEAFTRKSQFDQFLNWRIDKDVDEFVIRLTRHPEAPSSGHINVDVKIEGGLSPQPDGSVVFDGGLGNGERSKVSKFSLSFEISHECTPDTNSEASDSQAEWEQPEEHEVQFFHHPEHKLVLAPENYYNDVSMGQATCDACTEFIKERNGRWVYECRNKPDCDYCVHVKCAQMARTIRHPDHVKHSLKLLKMEPEFWRICDVCKADISCGLFYNCAKCDFDVHAECPKPEEARGDGVAATVKEQEEQHEEERVTEMTPAMVQLLQMEKMQLRQMQRQRELQLMEMMMSQQAAARKIACDGAATIRDIVDPEGRKQRTESVRWIRDERESNYLGRNMASSPESEKISYSPWTSNVYF